MAMASSGDNGEPIRVIKNKLDETESLHQNIKREFDDLKKNFDYQKQAQFYLETLENERLERKRIEEEAVAVLAQVKEKYEARIEIVKKKCKDKINEMKKNMEKDKEQFNVAKEEASNHISTISSVKVDKEKVDKALDLEVQKNKTLKDRLGELQSQVKAKEFEHSNERVALQETINQHLKLIDSLKKKVDNSEKQKNVKIDKALESESQKNKALKDRLEELQNQIRAKDIEHSNERIALQETINQHLKLIDSFKKKVDNSENQTSVKESLEKDKLEIELRSTKREFEKLKERVNVLREMNAELRKENSLLKEEIKNIKNGTTSWQVKFEESEKKIDSLNTQIKELEVLKQSLTMRIDSVKSELSQKEMTIKKLGKTNEILKMTCSQLEEQAEGFRAKFEGSNKQKINLLTTNNETANEIQKLMNQNRLLEQKLEKEVKNKELISKDFEELQRNCEIQYQEMSDKITQLEEELEKEKQRDLDYEDKLSEKEHVLYSSDELINKLQEKICLLEDQLIAIKEEAAKHISTISSVKIDKEKVDKALELEGQKNKSLKDRLGELQTRVEAKEFEQHNERIAMQETINQHLKLIDFLKEKVDTLEKQKKPWFCVTPTKNASDPYKEVEWKELDRQLAEERTKNRRLSEQLNKTKRHLNNYKIEVGKLRKINSIESQKGFSDVPSPLQETQNISKDPIPKETLRNENSKGVSIRRMMSHDIPHRFAEAKCRKQTKCIVCSESIYIGREMRRCSECGVSVHSRCSQNLPNNCGLPLELMQHAFSLSKSEDEALLATIKLHPLGEDDEPEPSAPPAFPSPRDNDAVDNENSMSQFDKSSDIREIEKICQDDDKFSFTDSIIEALENEK